MRIEQDFLNKQVLIDLTRFLAVEQKILLKALNFIGLQFVTEAREKTKIVALPPLKYPHEHTGFYDLSGNLRSSIGYIILSGNNQINSDFQTVNTGVDGRNKGLKVAKELGKEDKGLKLIVVAGMDYAVYVESLGYDVISSSVPLKQAVEAKLKLLTGLK